MKKRIKLKNRNNKKRLFKRVLLFICLIVFLSISIFSFYNHLNGINIDPDNITNILLYEGNHNLDNPYNKKDIFKNAVKFLLNVSIDQPSSIISSYEKDEEYSLNSKYIEDPNTNDIDKPLIYIYNTHQLEEYKNTNTKDYSVIPNVLLASYSLREKLNKKNLNTIVETSDISELLRINNYAYYKSYDITRNLIISNKEKYPSLKYYIDLHRDSVTRELSTINYKNKNYAKVLFIVGLENPSYNDNLVLMDNLCNLFNKTIPSICKGIYKKQGEGVNGIYNQDIDKNVFLIEVGGTDNTIEEVDNTLDVFVNVLSSYIGDNYEK